MVSEPHKELRFTRAGQAAGFCVAGAVLAGIAVTLAATGYYRPINPAVPHPAWALPFAAASAVFFLLGWHLTKHAYLILTPMGLEVFPFFRPSKGMQVVMWQEIDAAEVNDTETRLSLHYNPDKTAGMHLSLRPLRRKTRSLLAKAVLGRVSGVAT
ncbi:hypothetical protein HZ994_00435 [Akkermansiaceae bacterium]|nr:hypothetical protein HZ994_00435 [Akkermansiaceae bacterium]